MEFQSRILRWTGFLWTNQYSAGVKFMDSINSQRELIFFWVILIYCDGKFTASICQNATQLYSNRQSLAIQN